MEFFYAPIILFLVIVAPIWLILHYRYKSKMAQGISSQEVSDIEEMLETLDKLIDRVETLEEILDAEHPNWRKSTGKRN
ncbi:envelope stress response membrane protein PspB [Agarilytica rhodophyticola]|uniref:envelope stress response membrane protein PspB n=1 Tax=Agarilytica rhodophyticola TaxID=1737490 RepID=UPI000B346C77|nr:envelope stress response membrane protein PspB [Agarilytica rhodophyticola]